MIRVPTYIAAASKYPILSFHNTDLYIPDTFGSLNMVDTDEAG